MYYIEYVTNILEKPTYYEVESGTTLREVFLNLNIDPNNVSVEGEFDNLDSCPDEGQVVSIKVVPADPTGGLLTTIIVTTLVSATVGYLAYKLLAPDIPEESLKDEDKRDRITGAKNEAKPYEPVPIILGKRKVAPLYAAKPYTDTEGNDDWYNMLLCVGYGPLQLRNFKIGETPLAEYEHQIAVVDWFENSDLQAIYNQWPEDVAQESVGVDLLHPSEDGGDMSIDITLNEGWVTRSTQGYADDIGVDFFFPRGTFREDKHRVACFQYQYQEDNGDWITIARLARRVSDSQSVYVAPYAVYQSTTTGDYYTLGGGGWNYRDKTSINGPTAVNITQYAEGFADSPVPGEWLKLRNVPTPVTSDWLSQDGPKQQRKSLRHDAPDWSNTNNLPVNLRARKVFPKESPNDGLRVDSIQWEYIRTFREFVGDQFEDIYLGGKPPKIIDGFPYQSYRPVLIALRVKATGQLSGGIDSFNVEATSVVPSDFNYDWRKWTDFILPPAGTASPGELKATDNPAELYRWFLQGAVQENPLTNDRIDIDGLFAWRTTCQNENWVISKLIDYESTLLKELNNIAFTGRAEFAYIDGQYTIVQKVSKTYPVQVFTPKNSWDFSSERVYPDPVDGIKFEFENKDKDYQKDEGFFYDPDVYDPSAGIDKRSGKFNRIEFWGISDYDLAYKHARFSHYEQIIRREAYTFSVDFENIICTRGDLITIQNDIIDVGLGSGRVAEVGTNEFWLDETINLVVGDTYAVEFRTPYAENGEFFHLITATYDGGGRFIGPIPAYIDVGDFAVYGEVGNISLEAIVDDIQYSDNLEAKITAVNYSDELFTLDQGSVPAFNSALTTRADWKRPLAPTIGSEISPDKKNGSLNVNVGVPITEDVVINRVVLEYRDYPSDATANEFFSSDQAGWTIISEPYNGGGISFEVLNASRGNVYQFRARTVSSSGIYSPNSVVIEYNFVENPAALPSTLTVTELVNTPPTPDTRYSTLNIEVVDPVGDGEYLSSVIDYRVKDLVSPREWQNIGLVKEGEILDQVVTSDGTTFEVRARSVSVFNEVSSAEIIEEITVVDTLLPDFDDGTGFGTAIIIPDVTGLELFAQGNDTEFQGRDAKFTWNKTTAAEWIELGNEGAKGAGLNNVDLWFKDYFIEIWANNVLVREETVLDNTFTYTYEMNVEDYKRQNATSGAWRDFEIRVFQRNRTNQRSTNAAILAVSNPAPQTPVGLYTSSAPGAIIVGYTKEPSDVDFEGIQIWISKTGTLQENLIYKGGDSMVILEGMLTDETGADVFEVENDIEYRIDISSFDSFGYVGVAPISTYYITPIPLDIGTDTQPCPPANLGLSEFLQSKTPIPGVYVDASWDASVGVWDDVALTCDIAADPGIITGYYLQWNIVGQTEVSETFTSSTSNLVSGLQPNTSYEFRVKAIDWTGNESPFSADATITTQGSTDVPNPPTGVSVTQGLDKLVVKWTNPSDVDYAYTIVYLGVNSNINFTKVFEARSDTAVLGGLSTTNNYYIKLRSVNTSDTVSPYTLTVGPFSPITIDNTNIDEFMSDNAIVNVKLADSSVDASKLSNLSVTAAKLANNSVDLGGNSVFGQLNTINLADAAVDGSKLAALSVDAGKLVDSAVTSTKIANLAVGTAAIANAAITNVKIGNAAVDSAQIANAAIGTAAIANAAITNAKIGNAAVTNAKIGTAAITTAKIADATITDAKIGSLDATKITTGLLNADRIGANTITASKINVTNLSAVSADLGTITAGTITGGTIRTASSGRRVSLSPAGIEAYNSVGTRTFHVDTFGGVTIGSGSTAIGVDTSGNVTIPGETITDTLTGNIIRTASSGWRAEMGPDIFGSMFRVTDGSTTTFNVDTLGNVSLTGNVTITGTSTGIANFSDSGTLATKDTVDSGEVTFNYAGSGIKNGSAYDTDAVAGTNAATVRDNASDGKTAFDGTTLTRNNNSPSGSRGFSGVSNQATPDGNIVSTVSYTYTQGSVPADFLLIYVREGTLAPTSANTAYTVNPVSGEIKLTLKPSTSYRFGIEAVRHYDGGLAGSGILSGSGWTTTTPAGDYTGTVDGTSATTVKDGAVKANSGLDANGDVTRTVGIALPNNTNGKPTATGLHMNSEYLGFYNNGWVNYFRNNGDAIIGSSGGQNVSWVQNTGTLTVTGDIEASNITGSTITGSSFETAASGSKLIISDVNDSIEYYNASNDLVFHAGPGEATGVGYSATMIVDGNADSSRIGAYISCSDAYTTGLSTALWVVHGNGGSYSQGGGVPALDASSVFLTGGDDDVIAIYAGTTGSVDGGIGVRINTDGGANEHPLVITEGSFNNTFIGNRTGELGGLTLASNSGGGYPSSFDIVATAKLTSPSYSNIPIGGLVFATHANLGTEYLYGDIISGSLMAPSSAEATFPSTSNNLSGTFQCLGYAGSTSEPFNGRTTLWIKILN